MIEVSGKDGGALFGLRVNPGAKKTELKGAYGGRLKLSVQEPPEGGRANRAAVKFLAKRLDIAKNRITITAGEASRDKRVRVEGLGAEELAARLEKLA